MLNILALSLGTMNLRTAKFSSELRDNENIVRAKYCLSEFNSVVFRSIVMRDSVIIFCAKHYPSEQNPSEPMIMVLRDSTTVFRTNHRPS